MAFGSEFGIKGITLKSADEKSFKINSMAAIGLKLIGIPHLGLRYRARKILKFIGNRKQKILDLGCGPGYYSIALVKKGNDVTGIDISEDKINIAKQVAKENKINVNFLVGDARKIPFKDNTFDLVICSEIIEHVKEDKKVIKEILRILKKRGRFIITTPADSKENRKIYKKMNHIIPGYNEKLIKNIFSGTKATYKTEYYGQSTLKLSTRINRNLKSPIMIAITFYPLYLFGYLDKLFKGEENSLIIYGKIKK